MTLTLNPQWELKETYHGIHIFRRVKRTGSSCGMWKLPGLYVDSLKQARAYIDTLPVGHFMGPGNVVQS